MNNLNQTLPNTLHELIVLAVKDMKLTEKDKKYYILMSTWHQSPNSFTVQSQINELDQPRLKKAECVVCMAGCVMAQTLGVRLLDYATPAVFGDSRKRKLVALDSVRDYNIQAAVNNFYEYNKAIIALEVHELVINKLTENGRVTTKYASNKKQFYSNMLFIAKILKSQNI